ncbi:hypothetical protein [Halochromatium roseum]|uniref:hypothetical protein n=1 Tax=Halochromatium roseum TaxID=391920 RepID=UPI001914754B|nr:hypothetical protein [Halochromatium roseum]MBK5941821.1 hypothetical protein [Halochromatium roseum]
METIQAQGVVIAAPKPEDFPEMTRFMRQYADLPMDLAAASLLLLAGQLGHGRIVSTDQRDFRTCRWKQHHPFINLLTLL